MTESQSEGGGSTGRSGGGNYLAVRPDWLAHGREQVSRAREPPPPVQPTGGIKCGSVQIAIFNCQTVLPLPRARLRS
jgi:hypothetical protein